MDGKCYSYVSPGIAVLDLTSDDCCAILSDNMASTEGIGGEVEWGEGLAGNVINRPNLGHTIGKLQETYCFQCNITIYNVIIIIYNT